ncbi:twin-arginine translocase subunit TatC [Paenibacillus harenae]|uniref:Sec-independent protein translocase protein TatC n=1 Tax=Paenibacillus harenae TaxID=306543 RepID=A0ABT9TZL5_PAEHA|nr:twin-arginine translocase subunit TatC [Paenibacillus harenae]MDQ0059351.1 sec-independent protein translocase protein TatC [Paenibacillus harenae]MDQ0112816.1 sec-independent protein translocase protein TatC [Paenibacillus harenae]
MKNQNEQNLLGHLEEMRARIIRTLIAFLVSMVAAFIYVRDIYQWLVRDMDQKLVVLGPSDVMWVYFMIAGVVAIAVTLPVAAYQTWKFVQPAVPEQAQRATLLFIPGITFLFVIGICFGYFILFPMVLHFMNEMAANDFATMYTAEKYFTFMIHMTVPFGILFEMPAVVMFLTKLGILNPNRLAKARKLAYFVLVIIAVTITPPDILSDIIVIVPLFLLYEISITISKVVYRNQLKMQNDIVTS